MLKSTSTRAEQAVLASIELPSTGLVLLELKVRRETFFASVATILYPYETIAVFQPSTKDCNENVMIAEA